MKTSLKSFLLYGLSLLGTTLLGWAFFKVDHRAVTAPTREPANTSLNSQKLIESPLNSYTTHPLGEMESELQELNKCYTQDCGNEKEDVRTEYFNLGQKIRQKLLQIQSLIEIDKVEEPQISKMAREFIENSDGHVQEAALDLMSTQEPSNENLQAILDHIIKGNDPELIHQALLELRRYPSVVDQETIRQTLAQVLLTGAPFVAQALAEKSELFINSQNIEFFEKLITQFDPQSLVSVSLQSSLKEYRRKSTAG